MYKISIMSLLVLFTLICGCSNNGGSLIVRNTAYSSQTYDMVSEKSADCPVTYRKKVDEITVGFMIDEHISGQLAVSPSSYDYNARYLIPYGSYGGYNNYIFWRDTYYRIPEVSNSVPFSYPK
jgi:hypothetical protein